MSCRYFGPEVLLDTCVTIQNYPPGVDVVILIHLFIVISIQHCEMAKGKELLKTLRSIPEVLRLCLGGICPFCESLKRYLHYVQGTFFSEREIIVKRSCSMTGEEQESKLKFCDKILFSSACLLFPSFKRYVS